MSIRQRVGENIIDFFFGKQPITPQQTEETKIKAYHGEGLYNGGQTGGGKWPGGLSNSGSSVIIDHTRARQNGRKSFHNSTQSRAIVTRSVDITVDTGLKLEPTPAWNVLGITDDGFKDAWTAEHEERFDIYMKSKKCHRAQTMTGYQLQRQYALFHFRDNDQFVRFYYSKNRDLPSPLQLKFIDPNQIRGYGWTDSYGLQQTWQDGILRDGDEKETHYKVWVQTRTRNGTKIEAVEIPARGARSKRIHMIHGFKSEYAGQGRGYSPLHFAVQDLENITDFSSAEIKKAINQSGIAAFVEPSENAPASNPLQDALNAAGGQNTELSDLGIAQVSDTGTEFSCSVVPEYSAQVPGSLFVANLNAGEKIAFPKNTSPGPQFDNFITSIMSYLASAYGLPIEVVLMKFNANYSASRASLLLAWQKSRIEQAEIDADLITPWWEMWLSEEIAAGRSQAMGWSDPRLRDAWLDHRLQGPPLPSISPRDDMAAVENMLKFSLTTQEAEARKANGSSAKSNITKNKKMFEQTPIPLWEPAPQATTPSPQQRGE